jgi:hypothetical protein
MYKFNAHDMAGFAVQCTLLAMFIEAIPFLLLLSINSLLCSNSVIPVFSHNVLWVTDSLYSVHIQYTPWFYYPWNRFPAFEYSISELARL